MVISADSGGPLGEPFGLQYGELEELIVAILGGHREKVVTRFRKLRPKFAPDLLMSRPGVRVTYDLPRVLSISAVFMVNSVTVPQAQAVNLVIANFPEIARGCLLAWEAMRSGRDDHRARSIVFIRIDAFDDAWESNPSGATWASVGPGHSDAGAQIVVDCHHIVANLLAIQTARDELDPLRPAFEEFARSYGWVDKLQGDPPVVPARLGSTFFSTGPYFPRALAILAEDPEKPISALRRAMLQAHLDYIEAPPPIDAWKMYLGTEQGAPRLCHLVAVWGTELGLRSSIVGPEVLRAASYPSDVRAAALIKSGERRLAELIEAPQALYQAPYLGDGP